MAKAVIPEEIFAGFQIRHASNKTPSADGGKHVALAFLTYTNEKGKLQHQESFDTWRDKDIPRIPFDNNPTTGMIAIGFANRYYNSNKLIRIEDPRNFQVEITVENFLDILKDVTMINGAIQDEMAWGWDGKLKLYKVGADDYLEAKANFEYGGCPTIPIKDVGIGSEVMLSNGHRGIYYGGWHVVQGDWGDKYDGYFDDKSEAKPIETKRFQFFRIGDKFDRWSSIQVKHIFEKKDYNKENALLELRGEVKLTIKREILKTQADREIKRHGLSDSYDNRKARAAIYNAFGLDDNGFCLLEREKRWKNIFRFMYAINDKPIKQDWFEEFIAKEKVKYE